MLALRCAVRPPTAANNTSSLPFLKTASHRVDQDKDLEADKPPRVEANSQGA